MTENFHDELCRLAAMFNEARVHD
ncbi:protein YrbN [Pectobacterium brasiliense]|nr:protein YrbN [Pectobacterium brasiliense]MCA5950909.1 protein YrbN [Pectobacterium versatile]MCA6951682.1 protein YrbN [Pectobacterium polaris]MCA6962007.1 protein YrbN [Pectobacterium odoriferum]MCA6965947.1 protein YrbN [Pectobacterium carotovorum]UEM41337.1 protein YrbN [Pectobacterium aquaticum]